MIIIMGIAGAGKGTQSKLLTETFGFNYLSTGELLRAYGTPEQHTRMLAGEILDDQEIIAMVDEFLGTLDNPNHLLLDGFPRTVPQADWLLKQVETGRLTLDGVVHLAVSRDVVEKRLLLRGRNDDTSAAIARRFDEYAAATLPILTFLKQHGVQIHDIDADQAPDMVNQTIVAALDLKK